MGLIDPRLLIPKLEDLGHGLQQWSVRATDELALADYVQRQAGEEVADASRRAAVVATQAEEDLRQAEQAVVRAATVKKKCRGEPSPGEKAPGRVSARAGAGATGGEPLDGGTGPGARLGAAGHGAA